MIESRVKKQFNATGLKKEYYLESLDEWLDIDELTCLKGCDVTKQALQGRMYNKQRSETFETLDGCVYTPQQQDKSSMAHKRKIREHAQKLDDAEFARWLDCHNRFIIRPYKPRMLGNLNER